MKVLPYLLLVWMQTALAQLTISGITCDRAGKSTIAFASVGMVGKTVGTLSNANGIFELKVPEKLAADSIKFSAIGYQPLFFKAADLVKRNGDTLFMEQVAQQLEEVQVSAKKVKYKVLGTTRYTTNNCTGFADLEGNWKGSEAAILIKNKKALRMEAFSFYIIQNKYPDSLPFRLMFYKRIPGRSKGKIDEKQDWVGPTFLKKPVIFKIGQRQGEFTLALSDYNIRCSGDFFISLECLVDEMEMTKFCYAGSTDVSSYFKVRAFSTWRKTYGTAGRAGGGGADFNVKVSYSD